MERSVLVRSDRNIQVHLWRWTTLTGWTDRTEIYHSIFINWSLLQLTGAWHWGMELKMEWTISLGWPGLIGKWRSILHLVYLGWSDWSNCENGKHPWFADNFFRRSAFESYLVR